MRKTTTSRPELSGGFVHEMATDPFLDWVLILAIALTSALILVGAGISVYLGTKADLDAPVPAIAKMPPMPIDEAALDKALQAFEARAQEKDAVMRNFSIPRDPSLP